MNSSVTGPESQSERLLPCKPEEASRRWLALYSGEFYLRDGQTRMGKTQHFGPLRVQRPFFPEGPETLHLYLLHPPGGLVGGDHLSINLHGKKNSHILMTTPSAGKLYHNISDLSQGQRVIVKVEDNAIVEYLPQENIIFNGAHGVLDTTVEIDGAGIFMGWEITCLGRPESQELFESGSLIQSLMVYKSGKPLFLDRVNLQAESRLMSGKSGFQNLNLFGTFIITADVEFDYGAWQESMNQSLKEKRGGTIAITQKPGVLIARILGSHTESMRQAFESLWQVLRPLVINKQASTPRIWLT